MNPVFGTLLIVGLSLGILARHVHESREISLEQKEQIKHYNELKAEQLEGIDNSSGDKIIKIL